MAVKKSAKKKAIAKKSSLKVTKNSAVRKSIKVVGKKSAKIVRKKSVIRILPPRTAIGEELIKKAKHKTRAGVEFPEIKLGSVFREGVGKLRRVVFRESYSANIINFLNNSDPKIINYLFGMIALGYIDVKEFINKTPYQMKELNQEAYKRLTLEEKLAVSREFDELIESPNSKKIDWCKLLQLCDILDFSKIYKNSKKIILKTTKRVIAPLDEFAEQVFNSGELYTLFESVSSGKKLLVAFQTNPQLMFILLAFVVASKVGWEMCDCSNKRNKKNIKGKK